MCRTMAASICVSRVPVIGSRSESVTASGVTGAAVSSGSAARAGTALLKKEYSQLLRATAQTARAQRALANRAFKRCLRRGITALVLDGDSLHSKTAGRRVKIRSLSRVADFWSLSVFQICRESFFVILFAILG